LRRDWGCSVGASAHAVKVQSGSEAEPHKSCALRFPAPTPICHRVAAHHEGLRALLRPEQPQVLLALRRRRVGLAADVPAVERAGERRAVGGARGGGVAHALGGARAAPGDRLRARPARALPRPHDLQARGLDRDRVQPRALRVRQPVRRRDRPRLQLLQRRLHEGGAAGAARQVRARVGEARAEGRDARPRLRLRDGRLDALAQGREEVHGGRRQRHARARARRPRPRDALHPLRLADALPRRRPVRRAPRPGAGRAIRRRAIRSRAIRCRAIRRRAIRRPIV